MDYTTLHQKNSCLSSWDSFQHCYPEASKWASLPMHYGCKLWTVKSHVSPYLLSLKRGQNPYLFIINSVSRAFERTVQNVVCYGINPVSFSHITQLGLDLLHSALLGAYMTNRYLTQNSIDTLVEAGPGFQAIMTNLAKIGETLNYKISSAFFSIVQINRFEFNYFRKLDAFSDESLILHEVVESNDRDTTLYFLNKGFRINQRDSFGNTPLHRGAMKGAFYSTLCLLENNADISVLNDEGRNFLEVAIQANQVDFIKQLLSQDLKVPSLDVTISSLDIIMPWDEALAYAIGTNQLEIALLIARSGKVDLREKVPDETFTFEEFLEKMSVNFESNQKTDFNLGQANFPKEEF